MNFYISISQLIQAAEDLENNLRYLSERSFRISPRDSRANRDLLKKCAAKIKEAREVLGEDTHLSKISLRHAALLGQIFQLSFRRMALLASAVSGSEEETQDSARSAQDLFSGAYRHYGLLQETLTKLAGIPVLLKLDGPPEKGDGALGLFQREESYRNQILGLLSKALEVFDEEPELFDTLHQIRQDLLQAKRKGRRLTATPAANAAPPSPILAQR